MKSLIEKCSSNGINLAPEQAKKIVQFVVYMLETNKIHNLTTITSEKDLINKHIIDSLIILKKDYVSHCETLFDIGSGAGFPGIILAIVLNKTKITLIESNKKKYEFLNMIRTKLELSNLSIYNQRAEVIFTRNNIFSADIITARAVSGISQTLEISCNGVKDKGLFIYYASKDQADKFILTSNIKPLGFQLHERFDYELPDNSGSHSLIIVKKLWTTNKGYPRSYSKIKSKPL